MPLFLSNPVEELSLAGTPSIILTNNAGVLEVNGNPVQAVNTWSDFPTLSNQIYFNPSNVLQQIGNDLYFNSDILAVAGSISNVADWYLYPALSGDVLLNSNVGIDFNGRVLTRDGSILRFGGVSLDDSEWATYPAIATVDLSGNAITRAPSIASPAGSNLALSASSNLTLAASNAMLGSANIITLTSSQLNPLSSPDLTLRSSNGIHGQINVTAGPGLTGQGGEIALRAEGGSLGPLGFGGLIELTATTPVGISNVTSAVKTSGASVTSYAGVTSALGSLFGYNFVHGDIGTSLTAGPGLPGLIPNAPGTVR